MPVRPTHTRKSAAAAHPAPKTPKPTTAPPTSQPTGWTPASRTGATVNTGDGFSPAPAATTQPLRGAGGPPDGIEYMRTSGGVQVLSQREAGDYYCEHTCWVLNHEATQPGSSIARNAEGNPLVGFLHLPGELDAEGPHRHDATREVIGAALRGDIDAVRAAAPGTSPVRVMLTGYGAFQGVDNNPTGDFVSHPENLDAAMRQAYGDRLVGDPRMIDSPAGPVRQYSVRGEDGRPFEVQLLAKKLDVDDSAIDGGPKSLQTLLRTFRPQAALSMGVDPGASTYEVVTRSDHGGMVEREGQLHHDDASMRWGREGSEQVQINDALGKAIEAGRPRVS